jgi:hypothetical protein
MKLALEKIARVNACDYEYQAWAREALNHCEDNLHMVKQEQCEKFCDAMLLALEALKNSVDLVSNEAREAESLYGKYPSRLARVQGLVALEVAHQTAIKALEEALSKQTCEMGEMCLQCPDAQPKQEQGAPDYWLGYGLQAHTEKPFEGATPLYKKPQPKQERGEPAAKYIGEDWAGSLVSLYEEIPLGTLLYTTPQQRTWVGLTNEERNECLGNYITAEGRARAIEAKLLEKNK